MKSILGKFKRSQPNRCPCCGADLKGHLPDLTFSEPFYWDEKFADDKDSYISSDFCVIKNENFFVRVVLEIPIIDTEEKFGWGVWVSLSEKNFKRYRDIYGTDEELKEDPYFGWFSAQLPQYPDCLKIKTQVHLQGAGLRPLLELDHTDPHPLCQEQHNGITLERAHELVEVQADQMNRVQRH